MKGLVNVKKEEMEERNNLHSSRWYFLELWVLPVKKNCKIVGVFNLELVEGCMACFFLSTEANSRYIFHLNQTTSLIYSHFVQIFPTLRRHIYLIDQLQYLLRNSRIVWYNSGIGGQSKNSYFAQDNSGLYRFLLCAEHIQR